MGSGYRTFAASETLTASNIMNYLMEQSVMYFATAAARTSAITSPEEGMLTWRADGGTGSVGVLEAYDGSAWKPVGSPEIATSSWSVSWDSGLTVSNGTYNDNLQWRLGDLKVCSFTYTTGSSDSFGADWRVTLPATANGVYPLLGTCHAYDSVGAKWYPIEIMGYSTTVVRLRVPSISTHTGTVYPSMTNLSGSIPFSWAAAGGDIITFKLAYFL